MRRKPLSAENGRGLRILQERFAKQRRVNQNGNVAQEVLPLRLLMRNSGRHGAQALPSERLWESRFMMFRFFPLKPI
jgi:hypothetical protein